VETSLTRLALFILMTALLSSCRVASQTAAPRVEPIARPTPQPIVLATRPPAPTRAPYVPSKERLHDSHVEAVENIFVPDVITVTVGTPLVWKNLGTQVHDVQASDRSWGGPMITIGGTWEYTFYREGVYDYYCSVHPGAMLGRVVVIR
jgi:plastocyanin